MHTVAQTQIQVIKMHKDFPIADLKPFPRNPRHNLSAINAVEKSLAAFGAIAPIVADENGRIAAGHTRYEAAIRAGLSTFPVIVCKFPDENSFIGYNITDNQTASIADWDDTELAKLLTELGDDDFDVSVLAFDPCEFDDILKRGGMGKEPGCDPDDVPETPVVPITKLGDLWLLGDHRLLCGDATKAENVARLMDGQKADMVFTDPPYGVDYEGGSKKRQKIENDGDCNVAATALLMVGAILDGGVPVYVCAPPGRNSVDFGVAFIAADLHFASTLIWAKDNSSFGRADYHWQHEPIIYGWRNGGAHTWCGDRKQTTLWHVNRPSRSDEHPTMKPVELVERAMINSSNTGDVVLDVFLGSGTTIIAAEQLHRKCYSMEIEPKYVQVAVKRWEIFTGKKAVCYAA